MNRPTYELVIRCPAALAELVSSWLFEAGAAGIEERSPSEDTDEPIAVELVVYSTHPGTLDDFEREITAHLAGLAADITSSAERVDFRRGEVSADWEHEWQRHLRPVPIGETLVVQPLGDESQLPRGRRPIVIRPSWAFGDGSHPTTQLAGDHVERYCRVHPGCRVLDVGTGSGVLGLVALCSGAEHVTLIDVAPEAVAAARDNAQRNGFDAQSTISDRPLADIPGFFDLVVANINEGTLCALANDLARVTAPTGTLLVTGLIVGETGALEQALEPHGLSTVCTEQLRDWVLLELRRR